MKIDLKIKTEAEITKSNLKEPPEAAVCRCFTK